MSATSPAPRAILFDIDGTLLRSRGSAPIFDDVMEQVFGLRGDLRSIRPDGMTDPDILVRLLDGRVPTRASITPRSIATFEIALARALAAGVACGDVAVWTLPGVEALLAEIAPRADVQLGIVTGNMRATARVKLNAVGLDRYFATGGFGSDSPVRDVLPGVALRRMSQGSDALLEPRRAVMIGDTPHDLSAARAHGMRCVLVATGQYTRDELAATAPDVLLDDLSDVSHALRAIFGEE